MTEKLASAAIQRDGETRFGFRSHYELRQYLEDPDPRTGKPGDVEGFLTSLGRFVTRREARDVAIESGQISPHWRTATRDLLSSDIAW